MTSRASPKSARALTLALALVCTSIALQGCLTPIPQAQLDRSGPSLDPIAFFSGRLTSWGVLVSRDGAPTKTFRVETQGDPRADGAVAIGQTIRWSDGGVDRRSWTLRRDAGGALTADLSDASGPVAISVGGPMLRLSYPMKTPTAGHMEQRLYLQPDGRSLLNEGQVRILGVTVARISEVITRVAAPSAG